MPSTQQLRNSAVGNRTARRCPWEPSGRYACNAHTIRVWGTAGSVRLGGARQDLSACPERPTIHALACRLAALIALERPARPRLVGVDGHAGAIMTLHVLAQNAS